MSAALDFRKCKRLLLSSLAVSLASRGSRRLRHDAPHRAKSLFWSIIKTRRNKSGFYGGETGICSCLLQSNPCEIFLCFAKAFGQPLKTTHRVVFLTLSFKSLLLSVVKQKRTSNYLSVISIGETGICSCLLQSNPCEIFLCFAKAFGQPLKTTHRVVFLTLSFKSLLLSIEKQNGQASLLVRFVWRRNRDLNPGYAPHVLLP